MNGSSRWCPDCICRKGISLSRAQEQSIRETPLFSTISVSAGLTGTLASGLRTIPRKGCFSGIRSNNPRRTNLAPVHRFGSHCSKSHILNRSPFNGLTGGLLDDVPSSLISWQTTSLWALFLAITSSAADAVTPCRTCCRCPDLWLPPPLDFLLPPPFCLPMVYKIVQAYKSLVSSKDEREVRSEDLIWWMILGSQHRKMK